MDICMLVDLSTKTTSKIYTSIRLPIYWDNFTVQSVQPNILIRVRVPVRSFNYHPDDRSRASSGREASGDDLGASA